LGVEISDAAIKLVLAQEFKKLWKKLPGKPC
jgi:hypothetical protein